MYRFYKEHKEILCKGGMSYARILLMDLLMEQILGTSFDHSDRKYIGPIIEYVKQSV